MKPIRNYKLLYTLFDYVTSPFKRTKKNLQIKEAKHILIFESHLIGDITLSIQLCFFLSKEHPQRRITLVANKYSQQLIEELNITNIQVIPFEPPWLKPIRDLKFRDFLNLILVINSIRKQQIDIFVENRGDVRNIVFAKLCRPKAIMAYNFTAGSHLVDYIVEDDGARKHLNYYNYQIAKSLGNQLSYSEYITRYQRPHERINKTKIVGLHFGASQEIRRLLPEQIDKIVRYVIAQPNIEKVIVFDDGHWAADIDCSMLSNDKISIQRTKFKEFLVNLQTIDILVCLDSGPSHICSLFQIPTIVLTGPSSSRYTHPVYHSTNFPPYGSPCHECNLRQCKHTVIKQCYNFSISDFLENNVLGYR